MQMRALPHVGANLSRIVALEDAITRFSKMGDLSQCRYDAAHRAGSVCFCTKY
jgi:hypothetical protein